MLDINKAQAMLLAFFTDGEEITYNRREVIITYDKNIESTFYIKDGCVKISSCDSKGKERIHYLYGKGDFFPVTWLFGNIAFQLEFSAFNDTTLLMRSLSDTKDFFETQPYSLLSIVEQQTSAYGRIINLNMGSARQRVAYRLISLCMKFGKSVDGHYVIDIPITIQELADMVRLTRERTGSIIAEFEREGAVNMGRRSIVIYDDKLKKYLEEQ